MINHLPAAASSRWWLPAAPPVVVTRRHLPRVVVTRRRLLRVVVTRRRLLPVVVTAPPPPQQGGYQPPPPTQQAYYPPQQGNYPAPGGYPPPAGPGYPGAQALNVGEAFSWAWNKFSKNAAALIVPTLVYGVIVVIIGIGAVSDWRIPLAPETTVRVLRLQLQLRGELRLREHPCPHRRLHHPDGGGAAIQSAFLGGLLDIANGQPVTIGSFFKPRNVGSVIIASLIIGIAAGIGFRSASSVGSWWRLHAVHHGDHRRPQYLSPIDAIKQSYRDHQEQLRPGDARPCWLSTSSWRWSARCSAASV